MFIFVGLNFHFRTALTRLVPNTCVSNHSNHCQLLIIWAVYKHIISFHFNLPKEVRFVDSECSEVVGVVSEGAVGSWLAAGAV